MPYTIESEVGGTSTQVGPEFDTVEQAAIDAFNRFDLARSLTAGSTPFRLAKVGANLTQTEIDLWNSEAARLGFPVY